MFKRFHKNQSGILPIIIVFLIGVSLILVAIWSLPPPQSAITVMSYSIKPPTVMEAPAATADLSIRLKNEDKNRSHDVKLVFTTPRYVTLSMGEGRLGRSDSTWIPYEFPMTPGEERTEHISVRARLEPGQTSAVYSILVEVYVDGKKIETKTQDLTVFPASHFF